MGGNAGCKLSDERFYLLSQSYETERKELEAEVISLQNKVEQQEKHTEGIEKSIRTAKQHIALLFDISCALKNSAFF